MCILNTCIVPKIRFVELKLFPDDKFLDSSKLKESADDNFKFDENGKKLSKRVENTVGKGEIARYEQFLLFPQSFQNACLPGASKGVVVWEWYNESNGSLRRRTGKMLVSIFCSFFPQYYRAVIYLIRLLGNG